MNIEHKENLTYTVRFFDSGGQQYNVRGKTRSEAVTKAVDHERRDASKSMRLIITDNETGKVIYDEMD